MGDVVYRGLAVLLIACPCALVISVPAAVASALSAGARRGLLVKVAPRWKRLAVPGRPDPHSDRPFAPLGP